MAEREVTVGMLEALEAFHEHCHTDEENWLPSKGRYDALIETLGENDEDIVQDMYHLRWVPPESDPLRIAVLHARRGLPWRVHLPKETTA